MCGSTRVPEMFLNGVFKSSLGIKYPTFRDHPLHLGYHWLEGKKIDDGAAGYWRIHDKLYDLTEFIDSHPGGKDWIKLTKGTDITEAFESHHLTSKAEELLPKFFRKNTFTPRNFPFTFHENGFYKVLKSRIAKKIRTLPNTGSNRSKLLTDGFFVAYCNCFLLAVYFRSFSLGMVAGICLALLAVASHNFFHQRDNFRRFYFDFSMMSSKEWRISHVLSHHMYTNTISDLEISALEPFLQYLPGQKNIIVRYGSWLYSPVVFAFLFLLHYLKTFTSHLRRNEKFEWQFLIPFSILVLAYLVTGESVWFCVLMYLWVITVASVHFGVVGVNAAHHHPDIFHDGDTIKKNQLDWGAFQVNAVRDRKDITGSHFLVLTNFGDHALHHLFPTIDHGQLEHLYPIFQETCQEFGIDWAMTTQMDLVKGQYMQLARVKPKDK